jgi:hypothetical protein
LVGSVALVGAVRLLYLSGPEPSVAGERATVAQAFAAAHGEGFTGVSSLQFAGYAWITDAFAREPTALLAVREAMMVSAVVGAALLWILARRLGLTVVTATAAVVLLAISPMATGLQRVALPENLAVTWVLAALVLLSSPREKPLLRNDILAAVCLLIAVLTAPLSLAMVPTATVLAVRGRPLNRPSLVAALPSLGILIGLGPVTWLRTTLPAPIDTLSGWLAVDPVVAVAWVAAAVVGCFVARVRPVAAGALILIAVTVWPTAMRIEAVALLAPFGSLLLAAVGEAVARSRNPRNTRGRHSMAREFAAPMLVVVGLLVAAAIPGWVRGLDALGTGPTGQSAFADAATWLRANASGEPVRADDTTWAELRQAGLSPVSRMSTCAGGCPASTWAVSVLDEDQPTSAAAVAVFGDGRWRVQISQADAESRLAAEQRERQARRNAGTALLGSARIDVTDEVAALLRDGRVDPRVIAVVAALAATAAVHLIDLPAVAGEDAANQPRRTVLLDTDDAADRLVGYFTGQIGVFRPESASATPDGVLARYPPLAPTGLLTSFAP